MTKWEYDSEGVDGSIGMEAPHRNMSTLEKKGKKGWELVTILNGRFIFKRPVPEPVKPMVQERIAQTDMGSKYGSQTDR